MPDMRHELPPTVAQECSQVGASKKHESAVRHVAGSAIYVDDHQPPQGTLHAYVGTSTVARGKITKLDLDAVKQAEGLLQF